ncbi:MAG: DUF3089 domain-containing protein [Bacteroidia bacterium]|nr:DUF3089 domain-containing protein [Bacteroidia bacterium]
MKNLGLTLLMLLIAGIGLAQKKPYMPKTSTFEPTYFPPIPDYANPTSWASLPTIKDLADTVPSTELQNNQNTAQVDVFYIHPTTYVEKPNGKHSWNADLSDKALNEETDKNALVFQASIFNESCKIYAPRYRQAHIFSFFTDNGKEANAAFDTAYNDVKRAFEYYLKFHNDGRPIIIASHTQGTIHAVRLLREKFVNKPLYKQLVAAYVVGMPVTADTLKGIPPCKAEDDFGCFVSWVTYANGYYPSTYELGAKLAHCTNPLTWKSEDQTYAESSQNMGGVLKEFKLLPGLCDAKVHQGILWINPPAGDLSKIANFNVADYHLFYMNIRENVSVRVKNYLK